MIDLQKMFSLDGRVALVTGGQRGIGRMITEAFLAAGARVIITGRKADQGEATAGELGKGCTYVQGDVSTVAGCQAIAEAVEQREPALDILVNNAGVAWGAEYDEFPENGWDKVMDTNVKGLFFLTQALTPLLTVRASHEAPSKVITVSSVDGFRVNPWETYSYQASKAAVVHLTRKLASKLIGRHVVVNGIAPGAFASDMNRAARDHEEAVARGIPARRVGTGDDMGATAVYLASRAGDYVVGTTIVLDGGIVNAPVVEGAVGP